MPIIKRQRKDGKVEFDGRAEYNGLRIQNTFSTNWASAKTAGTQNAPDVTEAGTRFEAKKESLVGENL